MQEKKHNPIKSGVKLGFSGYYKVQVVHKETGEIVEDRPWRKNLILNCGMNAIATQDYIANMNSHAIAGTGTRTNYFTSSTSTITQSGELVYLYERTGHFTDWTSSLSGYNVGIQKGDTLVYANGSRSFVLSASQYTLQVRPSYSIDLANSQSFTLWKTSQTGLQTEIRRAGPNVTDSTYQQGSSSVMWNCGTEFRGDTLVHRRTYNFGDESYLQTYREVGVAWTHVAGISNSFARALLDFPVVVDTGYRLRLVHDLYVTYGPSVERYFTASIGGWGLLLATESIQNLTPGAYTTCASTYVTTAGTLAGAGILDPYSSGNNARGFITTDTQSLAPFTDSYERSTGSGEFWESSGQWNSAYVTDAWQRIKSCSYGLYEVTSSNLRVCGLGYHYVSTPTDWRPWEKYMNAIVVRFNEGQTKTTEQRLSLAWRFSWDRSLS